MDYYGIDPFRVTNKIFPDGKEDKYYDFASFVIHWLIADSTDAAAIFEKLLKSLPIGRDPMAKANELLGTASSNFKSVEEDLRKIEDNEHASEFVKASLYMSKHIQLSLNDWLEDVLTIDTGGELVDKKYFNKHYHKIIVLVSWFPMQLLYFVDTVELAFKISGNVSMNGYFERIKITRDVCKNYLRWILIDGEELDYDSFSVSRGTLYNLNYDEFYVLCESYVDKLTDVADYTWYISGLLNFVGDIRARKFTDKSLFFECGHYQELQTFSEESYKFLKLAIDFSHLMAMLAGMIALTPEQKSWLDILFVTEIDDNQEFIGISELNNYVRFTNVAMVTLYNKIEKFHTFYKAMIDAHAVVENKTRRDYPNCNDTEYAVLSKMSDCVTEYKSKLEMFQYDDPKTSEIFVGLFWLCGYRYFIISKIANLETNYSKYTKDINGDFNFAESKKLIDSSFGARQLLLAVKLSKKLPLPKSTPKVEVYFDVNNLPNVRLANATGFSDRLRAAITSTAKLMDQHMKSRLGDYLVVS